MLLYEPRNPDIHQTVIFSLFLREKKKMELTDHDFY